MEEVGFGGFDGGADGEQRVGSWNVVSKSVVSGNVRRILDVVHERDNESDNDDDQEEVTTPLMRSLEDLGSSNGLSDGSRSMNSIPEDADFTGGENLAMSSAESENSRRKTKTFSTNRPGSPTLLIPNSLGSYSGSVISSPLVATTTIHSPAHSQLLDIYDRHYRFHSIPMPSSQLTKERERETVRRLRIIGGTVGALVFAVAGWRIFGGVTGPLTGDVSEAKD